MAAADANDPEILRSYEGLIFATTRRIAPFVEEDPEDIRQIFRLKVWRALVAFDSSRCSTDRDRYVFMCVANQKKDLLKRLRRGERSIEELTSLGGPDARLQSDRFERRHGLITDHDSVYGSVDDSGFRLPNTLTATEQDVICLLYEGYLQTEVRDTLGLSTGEMERTVKSVRAKLADWRPAAPPQRTLALELDEMAVADPATQVAA